MGCWPLQQVGDGRLAPTTGGRWEVGPYNRWEMGGWPLQQVGDGRLAPTTGGRWEVDPYNRWDVGPYNRWEMGGWPLQQVGDGKLRPLPHPLCYVTLYATHCVTQMLPESTQDEM